MDEGSIPSSSTRAPTISGWRFVNRQLQAGWNARPSCYCAHMAHDPFDSLLSKIQDQQSKLSALSTEHEMLTRQAYLAARDDINTRMSDLISSRGGLDGISGRDRWRLTRDTGLIEVIDRRLVEMGVEHSNIVTQAFQASGALAQGHISDEIAALVHQINSTSGIGTPLAAAVDFARLDTTAIELGLGTAIADTTALSRATRLTLQREITAGVAAGESISTLSNRISGLEGISRNRAEVITRWSTIKSYNLSHQAAYESAETTIPGLRKMWLTQNDERTCPHCLAQNGIVVDVVDEFDPSLTYAGTPPEPYQGFLETPPLHPRCRCTITSWHESWRAYTETTPQELNEGSRERAIRQEHPNAPLAGIQGVAPVTGIQTAAGDALGDLMRGLYVFDDFSGTARIVRGGDMNLARRRLRDAGFRVRSVEGADDLLRIDFPRGLRLPRMVRSSKLRAVSPRRWDEISRGMRKCGLSS